MKLWYHAGFTPMDQLVDVARILDEAGFEGIALTHHLVNPQDIEATYPYSPDGKVWWDPATAVPDVWVTAAVIGQATKQIQIAPSVFILPMQDVFTVAKAVTTAAYYVDGRVILGIGAGWMKDEFDLTGQDFATRGARTDEMVEILGKLFSGEMTEHHGRFYHYKKLRMEPLPTQGIPIYVGGQSPAALRRAAHSDGWLAAGPHEPPQAIEYLERFRAAREKAGTLDKQIAAVVPLPRVPTKSEWDDLAAAGATAAMVVPAMDTSIRTLDDRRRYIDGVVDAADGR